MRIEMTEEDARRLAEKLAEDDEFRETLLQDPRGVLLAFKIYLEPEDLPKVARLPSKDAVRRALQDVDEVAESQAIGHYNMLAFLFSVFPPSHPPEVVQSLAPARKKSKKKTKKRSAKAK